MAINRVVECARVGWLIVRRLARVCGIRLRQSRRAAVEPVAVRITLETITAPIVRRTAVLKLMKPAGHCTDLDYRAITSALPDAVGLGIERGLHDPAQRADGRAACDVGRAGHQFDACGPIVRGHRGS